ncbi:hypothetical protein MOQ72_41645 [Saccharopolyspora sp. K220]|uniref:hypothetical protein n=1 Tax=Saccharopolyspora soli TaxID=2926618 RepID=UPI001F55E311|nr:hypothetical protein [Saccharopolyspora soli]MCI2423924.1 hypothetical protein [Saccharopolyspora soli]
MSEGDGGNPYQTMSQSEIDAMRNSGGITGMMGNVLNVTTRMADNAALAAAQDAHGQMRLDPDGMDKLAQFFSDEAQAMQDRLVDVQDLASVNPPGSDPVSSQAADVYGQVASGGGSGYLENYKMLIQYFSKTAEKMRDSAKQARTDDQDSAESFRGGNVEA